MIRPISWAEAETIVGQRVDRRRAYAVDRDESGSTIPCDVSGALIYCSITASGLCSGCACDCHPGCSHGAGGCHECGYSGRRRVTDWVPYLPKLERELRAEARRARRA